jgi:hypothetical protein
MANWDLTRKMTSFEWVDMNCRHCVHTEERNDDCPFQGWRVKENEPPCSEFVPSEECVCCRPGRHSSTLHDNGWAITVTAPEGFNGKFEVSGVLNITSTVTVPIKSIDVSFSVGEV